MSKMLFFSILLILELLSVSDGSKLRRIEGQDKFKSIVKDIIFQGNVKAFLITDLTSDDKKGVAIEGRRVRQQFPTLASVSCITLKYNLMKYLFHEPRYTTKEVRGRWQVEFNMATSDKIYFVIITSAKINEASLIKVIACLYQVFSLQQSAPKLLLICLVDKKSRGYKNLFNNLSKNNFLNVDILEIQRRKSIIVKFKYTIFQYNLYSRIFSSSQWNNRTEWFKDKFGNLHKHKISIDLAQVAKHITASFVKEDYNIRICCIARAVETLNATLVSELRQLRKVYDIVPASNCLLLLHVTYIQLTLVKPTVISLCQLCTTLFK